MRLGLTTIAIALLACAFAPGCGSTKDAGGCTNDSQCDVGSVCVSATVPGSCVVLPTSGGACLKKASAECAAGLLCAAGTCVSPGSRKDGEPCSHNVDCVSGLICDWSSSPYVCGRPKYGGETCGNDTDCVTGLVCKRDGTFSVTGYCQCPSCAVDEVCGATGCIKPGTVPLGEVCYHNVDCDGGNICLWAGSPHVCAPPATRDAACGHDTDCASGLLCAQYRRICRPTCHRDSECGSGELCVGYALNSLGLLCVTPGAIGARCLFARQCAEGLACIDLRCAQPKPLDAACDNSEECAADAHCDPTSKRCTADLPQGSSCPNVFSWANGSCRPGLYCQIGCDLPDDTLGVCQPQLSTNEVCTNCSANECEAGLECRSDPNGEGRRCLAPSSQP